MNILLEGYDIQAPYLYETLKNYIKPAHKVAVIAFSFRDTRVKNASDWERLYGRETGYFYKGIVSGFSAYGIHEDQITFLNYFTDTKESAKKKVDNADILYFLGGLPDRMMERIEKFELRETLMKHNGIVMGYSAGAVIQLAEYHLSPDHDYPAFGYYQGLPYLDGFYLEVHYGGRAEQDEAIRRVLAERNKPVYATSLMKGAIVVDNETIELLGDVSIFDKVNDIE